METLLVKVSERKKANMLLELLKSMDFIESVDLMGDVKSAKEAHTKVDEHLSADTSKAKLSDKYRGILSKAEGQKLNGHIKQMRNEWNNI
jgi:hypothetical protein